MTLSRRWVRGAVWVVLLMLGSAGAHAQEVSGSISGTVVDASGASVSGAAVTVTNTDRAYVERTLMTNKAGFYAATSLPLGNYSVTFAMKGFKTASVTGLVLNASDQLKVDQKLVVGAATESITVVASEAQLNLENGMSEGLINGTQVREMILNNRNYEQLLTLQPGVSFGSATNDQVYIGVESSERLVQPGTVFSQRGTPDRQQLDDRWGGQRGSWRQPDAPGIPQRGCDRRGPDAARNL